MKIRHFTRIIFKYSDIPNFENIMLTIKQPSTFKREAYIQHFPHMTCMQHKFMSRFCAINKPGNVIYLKSNRWSRLVKISE